MKKQQGFSLIELLVVLGIIGALTAIAIPQYQKYQDKAKVTAAIATLTNMRSVVEAKIIETGAFPKDADKKGLGIPDDVKINAINGVEGNMKIAVQGMPKGNEVTLARSPEGKWTCEPSSKDLEVNGCKQASKNQPTP
ncbi:pilin [Salinivibrio proteolyticus]|uniref:Pilin n=1 Tax=Salinivibrio proteolyticus TaxID=334715 RepID=A0ABY7LHN8_9GAMM|nr:pilin [Salinivibrio proteolyticus]WBA15173.1 pilin [Salinivibrio proteolyticus]